MVVVDEEVNSVAVVVKEVEDADVAWLVVDVVLRSTPPVIPGVCVCGRLPSDVRSSEQLVPSRFVP